MIKSVLKKESEESEQMFENSDSPRSILKSNLKLEEKKVGHNVWNTKDKQ